MPTRLTHQLLPGMFALAGLMVATLALSAQPPTGDPPKKSPELPKTGDTKDAKDAKPLIVKLPDGTFLWLGPSAEGGEKVTLTPQEFQKLLDQVDQLKKQLATRKPAAPSGCAVRGRVEKRGEQLVAVLKLTYSFRTTQPQSAVSLGGRKAFLVKAALDGAKLPILDTGEEGFAAMIETAGDHTLVLDVEAPVTARGTKAEVGFDIGLPRSPITTLALDPPAGNVKRVNLTTRTSDPSQPTKAPEVRRLNGLDVKQLIAKGADAGLPLGPVESVEVTWDPPAAGAAQPTDQLQSAVFDVNVILTEGFIESTAKIKLRGPARDWKIVAPSSADVSVERVAAIGETGPTQQPVVNRPTDSNKLVWKVELPTGSTASDWVVTAVVRQARPKAGTPKANQPLAVGPFAVLDVLRQTGTVRVTAGPHTRFVFKHGPDLRRTELPNPTEDDGSTALFRLATGPTGANPVNAPLFTVEASPIEGAVRVKPTYKLTLTEAGWRVEARIHVKPIRTEIDSLLIDIPTEWQGLESASEPEIVVGVTQGKADGPWRPATVRLAGGFKQQFDVVLIATVPVPAGTREALVPLPRFPKAAEREVSVSATVPDGMEVRGTGRAWEGDQPAAWGSPLAVVPGVDGKIPKAATAISGKSELGFSRIALSWQPYRPDVSADIRAEITLGDRQLVIVQTVRLRSPDGFPKPVKFRGPPDMIGLKAKPQLDPQPGGTWTFTPPPAEKEATLHVSFAIPLPKRTDDGPWPLSVSLLWPTDATRTEATVRVWVNSVAGRTVSTSASGWRELPPEPTSEREALPALTLSASAEHPLILEVREAPTDSGAVAVWVERTAIEAWPTEDGATGYRARFRLQRWLTPGVELWLPGSLAGPNPTARVDGQRVDLQPLGEAEGGRKFRVMLPEGTTGRAVVLEVRYHLSGPRQAIGEAIYSPPRLIASAYSGPVRWLITEPADAAPLLLSGRARPEINWRWRGGIFAPTAATRDELDRWFQAGNESDSTASAQTPTDGERLAARQTSPEPVRVARVPWLALVIVCSVAVFIVVVVLTWLPTSAVGVVVALIGGAFGVGVVLYPQPAAQVVAASQPGLAIGLVAVAVQAIVRGYVRHRVKHLPGFSRTLPELATSTGSAPQPAPPGAASIRSRPGSTGSPAPTPIAPSGS
ncbi:MAG: hypothetical protein L0241_30465 [Planctomycetia bacterium]|nr:hypothetical protein [Planctomycetia bacterium]